MSIYSQQEIESLKQLDEEMTSELEAMLPEVLHNFSKEKGRACSVHSLHGTIGGKNNTYVDSIRTQFSDPNDFKAKWLEGFIAYIGDKSYSPLRNLMKDKTFRNYTLTFLERNFYRNLLARTRIKPNESLWKIWFGGGKFFWGLIIAPTFREKIWTNDVSEIRRANYMYWTVGHVMETGLIDPENNGSYKFDKLDDLLNFYRSILKRVSNSQYEKEIFDHYVEYLKCSEDPFSEPFLIPELRYAGLEVDHEHRLDFTILNSHTMDMIGFEFSPHSTHMSVSKIKDKLQKDVNSELSIKWNKEMMKRNKYFSNFGITTVTFTDDNLLNIPNCFETMKHYLSTRPKTKVNLDEQIARLENI
ncbi:topoisomerase II [Flavobacterium sp. MDT1-60]|uniref:topoisomerase II n=1 Tax=Flavobacterium sp. MDT1-60 TaxID=1979344 RepID=UPI00177F6F1A|nr:topoisomerase II [Flavobacterium sp. MDT1-60]QOG04657.1 topoisomerase II [Flavobacterium sp. MDT1-60]